MDVITRPNFPATQSAGFPSNKHAVDEGETDEESVPSLGGSVSGSAASESDEEDYPVTRTPDPAATRRSSRAAAQKFVNYDRKSHPQDHAIPFFRKQAKKSKHRESMLKTRKSVEPRRKRRKIAVAVEVNSDDFSLQQDAQESPMRPQSISSADKDDASSPARSTRSIRNTTEELDESLQDGAKRRSEMAVSPGRVTTHEDPASDEALEQAKANANLERLRAQHATPPPPLLPSDREASASSHSSSKSNTGEQNFAASEIDRQYLLASMPSGYILKTSENTAKPVHEDNTGLYESSDDEIFPASHGRLPHPKPTATPSALIRSPQVNSQRISTGSEVSLVVEEEEEDDDDGVAFPQQPSAFEDQMVNTQTRASREGEQDADDGDLDGLLVSQRERSDGINNSFNAQHMSKIDDLPSTDSLDDGLLDAACGPGNHGFRAINQISHYDGTSDQSEPTYLTQTRKPSQRSHAAAGELLTQCE
jgi:hypothetical protein